MKKSCVQSLLVKLLVCFAFSVALVASADGEFDNVDVQASASSTSDTTDDGKPYVQKSWYMDTIKFGSYELPFNWVTLLIGVLVFNVVASVIIDTPRIRASYQCTASHLLLKFDDDTTKKQHNAMKTKLESLKKEIGSDKDKFAECAAEHSDCPSKAAGGSLGSFGRGKMVPEFDKVCFDPDTPENTTVGPVKTNFGYHLIYIHNRTLPEPEKAKSD